MGRATGWTGLVAVREGSALLARRGFCLPRRLCGRLSRPVSPANHAASTRCTGSGRQRMGLGRRERGPQLIYHE